MEIINIGKVLYGSEKIADKAIAPCMGQVIGWLVSGAESGNNASGTLDTGTLYKVGAVLGIGGTNQARYCSNGIIGREGE